jgi:hypothetical protein
MLSRIARPAFVRRVIRCAPRTFSASATITVEGKTEQQVFADIKAALPNVSPDQVVFPTRIDSEAIELEPVDDKALVDKIAMAALDDSSTSEEQGLLHAIGLGPFHRKAALLATGAITAVSNEFYVLNEETYVAACLVAGFTTMFVLLREPALAAYKTFQEETLKAQQDVRAISR